MAETMEQYISKTRADYGSGIARPKIDDKDSFESKGQFLKELRDNTLCGSDHEDANEHNKKVLEIVDLFHIPNITQDQVMLRAFPMSLTGAAIRWLRNKPFGSITTLEDLKIKFLSKYCPPTRTAKKMEEKVNEKVYAAQVGCEQCKGTHYTKDCPLKEEGKTLEEAYYTKFGGPFQGGGYRAAAPGFYQRNNANPSYQERRQSMEETLSKFMSELAKRHEENSNMIKEIRASIDAAIRNQRASIKTLEIQIGKISKEKDPGSFTLPCYINNVFFDNALADLGASIRVMPLSTYLNLGLGELAHTKLIVELADRTVKYPKGIAKNVLVGFSKFVFLVDFIIVDMPEDVKVPLIIGRPFLSTAYAKIDVFKRKITLRVGDEKYIFKSVKPASSLIKRVYMLSLKERMELDLEVRLMEETLVLNRSLDPLYGDYINLNDLNVPLELRRYQVNDLMPTIEEGEVTDAPMDDLVKNRNDEFDTVINDYLCCCDYDKKIRIDYAHNLMFSCMIGFEFIHVNFFPILYVNMMTKKFYNFIMKDKLEYKGNIVLGALMSLPVFVGTFSVVTDFAVLEDIDDYRDEGTGDDLAAKKSTKLVKYRSSGILCVIIVML
ncbi:DNA-directed DNA polymerase [Tanacetum coccineum]